MSKPSRLRKCEWSFWQYDESKNLLVKAAWMHTINSSQCFSSASKQTSSWPMTKTGQLKQNRLHAWWRFTAEHGALLFVLYISSESHMQHEFVSSLALANVFIKHCFICFSGQAAFSPHQLPSNFSCNTSKGNLFICFHLHLTPKRSSSLGPLTNGIAFAFVFLQKSISSHLEVRVL